MYERVNYADHENVTPNNTLSQTKSLHFYMVYLAGPAEEYQTNIFTAQIMNQATSLLNSYELSQQEPESHHHVNISETSISDSEEDTISRKDNNLDRHVYCRNF